MIITRYLSTEILKTTTAVLLVLLCIALSNEFVVQLAKAAAGELPATVVLSLVVAALPVLLGTLLPLGFFLGIVLAYGRLFADSEMTVLLACGLSWRQLFRLAFVPACVLVVVAAVLQFKLIPQAVQYQEQLIAEAQANLFSYALVPGKFQKFANGKKVFFAEELAEDKRSAGHLFVLELPENSSTTQESWRFTVGKKAQRWLDEETQQEYLVVEQGRRYEGQPGEAEYNLLHFSKYGIKIKAQPVLAQANIHGSSMLALWHSTDVLAHVELQWRLAAVISVWVVVFLAVPLSVVRPRQGRYATLIPAIVAVMIYINLLVINRSWLQASSLPMEVGFWGVHALGIMVGLLLLTWRSGGLPVLLRGKHGAA